MAKTVSKPVAKNSGTSLSKEDKERVLALGIKASTEETARTEIEKILQKDHEIDASVLEDEDFETVLSMLEELIEPSSEEEEQEEAEEEENDNEEEADEEDLDELAEETEEEEEDEFEEEDEEQEAKPAAKKPVVSKKPEKPSLPVTVKEKAKRESSVEKFNPRLNKEHLKLLAPWKKHFPESDGFRFDLLKNGFTVRLLTENTATTIINFDEVKIENGKLFGNFYCNRFKSVEDLVKVIGEDYEEREIGMFRAESHPCIRKMSQDEVFQIFTDTEFIALSLKRAAGNEKRMKDNKNRLEEKLQPQKASKKPAPPVEEEEEEEEPEAEAEEEEEEEAPKPKIVPKKKIIPGKKIIIKKK